MKIGDLVELTETERQLLKNGESGMATAQMAFESAAKMMKESQAHFWEVVKEIVGSEVYDNHYLAYNTDDKDNHRMIIGKTKNKI